MGYYYGKQAAAPTGATGQQTANPPTPVSGAIPECVKHCDSDLAACLVDAQTFEQKQACREAADRCRTQCGEKTNLAATAVPAANAQPTVPTNTLNAAGAGQEPAPKSSPVTATPNDIIQKCTAKCGGTSEPCFSQCLYDEGGGKTWNVCPEGKACASDAECEPGGKCVGATTSGSLTKKGKCSCTSTPETPDANCPEGKGKAYDGCPCGEGYSTITGKCPTGYVFIKRDDPTNWKSGIPYKEGAVGTCQCQKAIQDWKEGKSGNVGEYQYPAGMEELMKLLMDRAKSTYGYDQSSIDAMFGRGFENLRTAQAGSQEQLNKRLAAQGMLGTGTALGASNDLSWATEQGINDLMRDIMIKNEEQKRADTAQAGSILGTGMGYEQLLEAINSGRRGESSQALAMFLALLQLFGGQTS